MLRLNLVKESDRCAESEQVCISLCVTNENVHKVTVDLCGRLETSKEAYEAAVQRPEGAIATAGKREDLHAEELAKTEERRSEDQQVRIAQAGGRNN